MTQFIGLIFLCLGVLSQVANQPILFAMLLAAFSMMTLTGSDSLKMPSLFSDHMVLQRERPINIWGWGTPGQKVEVRAGWDKSERQGRVGKDGTWSIKLPAARAGGPYSFSVTGDGTLRFTDVLIGDIWVCSGQSNMEFTVSQTDHAAEDIPQANHPWIRLFHVTKSMNETPQTDCTGTWKVCSPDSVASFSAAGYFFGKEIGEKTNVPIGLVDSTWGGTEAELWTSENGLLRLPEFASKLKDKAKAQVEANKAHDEWEVAVIDKEPGFKNWLGADANDASWTPTSPAPWSSVEALKDFDGSCWFRAEFNAPDSFKGKDVQLQLGVIDDDDITWVNGTKVGSTKGWNQRRTYTVPASSVVIGRNVVAVRVWDGAGEGGWSTPADQCRAVCGGQSDPVINWRYKIGVSKAGLPAEPSLSPVNNSLLFNGMINPLVNNPIKGVLWYQGEANVGRAFQYRALFPAMIVDWRRQWGYDFPFYFVQIAPFRGYGSAAAAELREAQNKALDLKRTGVVVVTDATGNLDDIHPKDKRTVGHRLALWALNKDYGVTKIEWSGPLYKSMDVKGNTVRVAFSHASGLSARDGELKEFEVAGADKVFHKASAVIEGDVVVVSSTEVSNPVAVRMGWSAAPQPNLFNSAGLPASPFRSDTWPGLTDSIKW